MLYVLKESNIEIGSYTKLCFGESDRQKQEGQNRKIGEKQKNVERLRAINTGHIDKDAEGEPSYFKGAF